MYGGLVAKSCPTLGTLWTVACQTPLSMGFPRQECQNWLPFLSPVYMYGWPIKFVWVFLAHLTEKPKRTLLANPIKQHCSLHIINYQLLFWLFTNTSIVNIHFKIWIFKLLNYNYFNNNSYPLQWNMFSNFITYT